MKKYNGQANVSGKIIEKARIKKGISKEDICRKLQLIGINMDRTEIYRMEKGKMIIKDFELVALCKILDINYTELLNTIHE